MRLMVRDDANAAASYLANYIAKRLTEFGPSPSRPFVLGLPTGSSPLGVCKLLVEKFKSGEATFKNVVTFNMDEYVGLPRDHSESYHSFMWRHSFSQVDVQPENVHILDGNTTDLEAECTAYEASITAAGGIDLFPAGVGEDGHVAFNEPGSSLTSRTRVKTLAYDTILANSRFFGNDTRQVPRMALTVGVQTVLDAREVVAIALGVRKALTLHKCIESGVNHMWTLSALPLHRHAMIVADEDATPELQVRTVKYFKSIEQLAQEQCVSLSVLETIPKREPAKSAKRLPIVVNDVRSPAMVWPSEKKHSLLLLQDSSTTPLSRSTAPEPALDSMSSRI